MCWRSRLAVGAASVALVEACDPVGVARCGALGLQEFLSRLLTQPVQLIRCPALQAAHRPVTLLYKAVPGFWLTRSSLEMQGTAIHMISRAEQHLQMALMRCIPPRPPYKCRPAPHAQNLHV